MKTRLDKRVFELGLAPSRERAQALILAGRVLVKGHPVTKVGQQISVDDEIRITGAEKAYVSRAAFKLKAGLDAFGVLVDGKIGLDVGASTGGFTEILLERGAQKVYAVDVGHNQLDYKIRSNPRVVSIEKCNARSLTSEVIPEPIDVVVVDVSFIGLTKVLPPTLALTTPNADWITLVKPQFEAGPSDVGKGGIVSDPEVHRRVLDTVKVEGESLGLQWLGLIPSPIQGTDGNIEFLVHWRKKLDAFPPTPKD